MMVPRYEIPAGHTLIVKGPASPKLLSGDAEVFGYNMRQKTSLVVRPWRALPIYSEGGATLEISLGSGASTTIVEGDTIPNSWRGLANSLPCRFRLLVLGGVDVGKTSLVTLIYNKALERVREVEIAELDVGQAEICPPTTMGIALGTKQLPDLYQLRARDIYPFGYTSPTHNVQRSIRVASMLAENLRGDASIIDVDGWVSEDSALLHKARLISMLRPTLVALIGGINSSLIEEAAADVGAEIARLEVPNNRTRRDIDARRRIREMNYMRFLKNSSLRSIPSSWVRILPLIAEEGDAADYVEYFAEALREVERSSAQTSSLLLGSGELDLSSARIGLISYIYDTKDNFVGLGIFMGVDKKRGVVKIYTPYKDAIKTIKLGSLFLSTDCEEIFTVTHKARI